LAAELEAVPPRFAEGATQPGGFIFPGSDHGHLTAGHVGKLLKRLLGDDFTAHTLRHRFATVAYAADRDLLTVQQLLGHSRPETTSRYTALPAGSLRAGAAHAAL
jgi:integrase